MASKQDMITLVDKLGQLGYLKPFRVTGNWYTIRCPFHGDGNEKKPSCGVLLQDEYRNGKMYKAGMFHCFACGYAKGMYEAVKEIETIYPISAEAKKWADENILPDGSQIHDDESLIPSGLISSTIAKFAVENLKLKLNQQSFVLEEELAQYRYTVQYMYDRKLTDEVIARYDVGFDANHVPPGRKKALPCVTFPVKDVQGRALFICRRSIEGKYFNYPRDVEKPVYGLYELNPNARSILICESCFNALTGVVFGCESVALLGTGTPYQIDQLRKTGAHEFVLCMDPDEAGRKGAEKLKRALSRCGIVREMKLPDDRDLNKLAQDGLTQEQFNVLYRGENQ